MKRLKWCCRENAEGHFTRL